jgi:hypothetical protein
MYRVVLQPDQTFAVEVTIPETLPATVTSFATAVAAEAWIAAHKQRIGERLSGRARWLKKR